jgi:hypothetical protein
MGEQDRKYGMKSKWVLLQEVTISKMMSKDNENTKKNKVCFGKLNSIRKTNLLQMLWNWKVQELYWVLISSEKDMGQLFWNCHATHDIKKWNVYLSSLMMKVPDHVYVLC